MVKGNSLGTNTNYNLTFIIYKIAEVQVPAYLHTYHLPQTYLLTSQYFV